MTERLLRTSLTGAYLVILYFCALPVLDPPRQWKNLVVVAFCVCCIFAFWAALPKALHLVLAALNVLAAAAVLIAFVLALSLGKTLYSDNSDVVPLITYFVIFVPIVAAFYLAKLKAGG
jgi:hypothetical protein